MSDFNLTKAQRAAIDSAKKTVVLSAAAGSGKTSTLTRRILKLIQDQENGCPISRMLIVTFTKAAAGELKSRIASALGEAIAKDPQNRYLCDQLSCLENAQISTIDSFFKTSVSPFFNSLGLPPSFEIVDEAEGAVMKKEAMEETVTRIFDGFSHIDREDLIYFADCLSDARTQGDLSQNLLKTADALLSRGVCAEDLLSSARELRLCGGDLFKTQYARPVKEHLKRLSKFYTHHFRKCADDLSKDEKTQPYVDGALECHDMAASLKELAGSTFSSCAEGLSKIALPTLRALRSDQPDCYIDYKELRNLFIGDIRSLRSECFDARKEDLIFCTEATAKNITVLAEVISKYQETYSAMKRERGVADFADLSLFAKELFIAPDGSPTPIAIETGKKFDHIFIDEYQDTNTVQDEIFNAISQNACRFMVGDVKQSIYGFRGSRPELFSSYKEKLAKGDDGEFIFMSENFRSGKCVIDFANAVSDYIFFPGSTPFSLEDKLICSGTKEEEPEKCEVILTPKSGRHTLPYPSEEAVVAARVSRLLNERTPDGKRKYRPKDIAILLRSASGAQDFADELVRLGIPISNRASEDFFNYGEVLLVLCFANTADNPLRDIYLAGTMKSPVFGFSLNELVRIRQNRDIPLWHSLKDYCSHGSDETLREKCMGFVRTVERWRYAAKDLTAGEMLELIISDTSLRSLPGDRNRSHEDMIRSLKLLCDHAAKVSKSGGTLHSFISRLNVLIEKKDSSLTPVSGDSVTIMTVHASKGLEFPVCILAEQSKRFNMRDTYEKLLIDKKGHIAMKLYDGNGLVRCHTPLRGALALGMSLDSIDEEARVLYVAMTRAKQRLIVSINTASPPERLEKGSKRASHKLFAHEVLSHSSYGDWIIDALQRCEDPDFFTYIEGDELFPIPYREKTETNASFDEGILSFIDANIPYSRDYLKTVPAKLTVSQLRPDILTPSDTEGLYLEPRPSPVRMDAATPLPSFLQEKKTAEGTEIGTATHIFMQFCDFERLKREGAEAELQRLLDRGFISQEDGALVDLCEIELFAKSSLMDALLDADRIFREQRFNTLLPAHELTENEALSKKLAEDDICITVQGVVDCIYCDKNGDYHLVDYKTDRLSAAELSCPQLAKKTLLSRHSRQLSVYRRVCEEIVGRPFKSVSIYSLPLGKVLSID